MGNDRVVVGGMCGSADLFRQRFGFFAVLVGGGDEAYRGMAGRELRAQAADTAGADDGKAYAFAFDDVLPRRPAAAPPLR